MASCKLAGSGLLWTSPQQGVANVENDVSWQCACPCHAWYCAHEACCAVSFSGGPINAQAASAHAQGGLWGCICPCTRSTCDRCFEHICSAPVLVNKPALQCTVSALTWDCALPPPQLDWSTRRVPPRTFWLIRSPVHVGCAGDRGTAAEGGGGCCSSHPGSCGAAAGPCAARLGCRAVGLCPAVHVPALCGRPPRRCSLLTS